MGRKVGAGLVALASAGGFAGAWLPHTVYIDRFREVVQFYQYGYPLKLTNEMQQRAQSVLRDVKINENFKKVTFFYAALLEPFFAGTPESGYGAIVGIPTNFNYKSVDDVPVQELIVLRGTKSVDWQSPAGKLLKESFVFTEEAQKYAIAQQIYLANSNHVTVGSVTAAGSILNIYILSIIFNRRFYAPALWARSVIYGLATAICGLGYIYIKDMTTYNFERNALSDAARLGPEYARGAIEYYEKNLVRNKALRIILEKKGASLYTARGNLNTLIRTPHMPLSACLDLSKNIYKEMQEDVEVEDS